MGHDTHTTKCGTKHHCPGAKISHYIKMGPCRADRWHSMCVTHEVRCSDPECDWIFLSRQVCPRCSAPQAPERAAQKEYSRRREQEVYDFRIANKGQKKGKR